RASFQLRQGELSPAAAGAASGPSSRLRGASVSQTLPISDPSCGRENPDGGGKLNCASRFLRCVPDERASAREDPGPRGGRLGRLPSPLWGGVGGGGRCCGARGVPHNDPHPRPACATLGRATLPTRGRVRWSSSLERRSEISTYDSVHYVDHDTASSNMAPPWPPPMHSVAMPWRTPRRFIALTRCSTMRLPLAPTGWPRPIAPPSTLSLSRSMRPAAALTPNTFRQNVSSSQAARQASTCAAKASLSSHRPISPSASECRRRIAVEHKTGPSPMMDGSSADHSLSTILARGVSPCVFIASSDARITHEAPSVICEELPAVTLPHGRSKAGLSVAGVSTVLSGRTPSSWSKTLPSRPKAGAISPLNQPSFCARASRCWLSAAY